MSDFTLTLKQVIDFKDSTVATVDEWLNLHDYPIFDESHRSVLNAKIVRHFWNREIGQETISLFRFALYRKMHEIMPAYNEHYRISALKIDPLNTVDTTASGTNEATSTSHGTGSTTTASGSKSRAVNSETPQVPLSGEGDYATSAADSVSDSTGTGASTEDRTDSTTATTGGNTRGYVGHGPSLAMAARAAIVNVDMMVISELEGLFMLIWATHDEHGDYSTRDIGFWF